MSYDCNDARRYLPPCRSALDAISLAEENASLRRDKLMLTAANESMQITIGRLEAEITELRSARAPGGDVVNDDERNRRGAEAWADNRLRNRFVESLNRIDLIDAYLAGMTAQIADEGTRCNDFDYLPVPFKVIARYRMVPIE